MTTPYAPMLPKDGSCLLMPNGSYERLDSLPRYQPQPAAMAPAASIAPAPVPAAVPTAAPAPAPASKPTTTTTKE